MNTVDIFKKHFTEQLSWHNIIDRTLPFNCKLKTIKNSIIYTVVHQLKLGTAACEKYGSISSAKVRLSSSLQPELFKR